MEEDARVGSERSQKKKEREIGQRMNGGAQDTSVCHILKKHLLHAKEF